MSESNPQSTEPWIVVVVATMGWQGHEVKFQEFTSQERAEAAKARICTALRGQPGHDWEVLCLPK